MIQIYFLKQSTREANRFIKTKCTESMQSKRDMKRF